MHRDARQVLTELLVLSAQAGSEAAFRDLHELWRADLRRLALARLGHAQGAGEVEQDAWIAIARGLPALDDPACFPRWACRIVVRRAADWVRRRVHSRRRATAAAEAAELLAPAPPPAAPADEVVALRAAIARLPADQRELLRLHYDLARPIADLAEVLGVPPGTVKSRLFAIREKLRQQLARNPS